MRNETFRNGVCVRSEIYDFDNRTVTVLVPNQEPVVSEISEEMMESYLRDLAHASALAKLQALGLTEAEALALVGGL